MKRILLLVTVASMLAAVMALSGVAQAGPIGGKADAQCLKLAIKTLGPSYNPSNYTFHGGTEGDDNFTSQGDAEVNDVFCGFGGDDFTELLVGVDIFLGGAGDDGAINNAGTFYGGAGVDGVSTNAGTFDGGEGDDVVNNNLGTYFGGAGNDFVLLNLGTFDGGDGTDEVDISRGGSCTRNVELGDVDTLC
jgi:hypothetical protein